MGREKGKHGRGLLILSSQTKDVLVESLSRIGREGNYPAGCAQPRHRAWVLLLYWRKCVCVCVCVPTRFVVEEVVVCCSCIMFPGLVLGTFVS